MRGATPLPSAVSVNPPSAVDLTGYETADGQTGVGTADDEGWGLLGKTYKPIAIKVEMKEEEPSSSSLPVIPSADEVGTKEGEAATSLPAQSTGEADDALASAVESLSLQENPLQADFGDKKMEQPPSLPEESAKSPKEDETMADAGSKKDDEEKSKSATKSVNKMT